MQIKNRKNQNYIKYVEEHRQQHTDPTTEIIIYFNIHFFVEFKTHIY